MRAFLLLFLAAWLGGVALGVAEERVAVLGAAVAVLGAGLVVQRWSMPYVASALILLSAGWFWGGISPGGIVGQTAANTCMVRSDITATIRKVHQHSGSTSQYVVVDERGCRALLSTSRFPEYTVGTELHLQGRVQALSEFPAEYEGYADYLAQRGIAATMQYPDVLVLSTPVADTTSSLRSRIRQNIEHTFIEPEAGIVTAMLLGESGVIPDHINEQLRITGISHIIAISGSHISLFVGMALIVLYLLPLKAWWRTGVLLVLVWGYIALVDFLPSALRAAFFWTITVVALQLRALISLPTLAMLTVAVMFTAYPAVIFDVGFQLSLAAVAGIALILFLAKRHWLQEAARKNFISNVALVSLGATATTWPLVAYHFGNISFISIIANILVVPVTPLFMALALLGTMLSFVFPFGAVALGFGVHVVWGWIELVIGLLARVPGVIIEGVVLSLWILPFYYFFLVVGATFFLLRRGRSWREVWE